MPAFIEGNPALIVVDIMGTGKPEDDDGGIPSMGGEEERVDRVIPMIEAAKANGVPVIYIIEVHRPDHVDFGRELGQDFAGVVEGRQHLVTLWRKGHTLLPSLHVGDHGREVVQTDVAGHLVFRLVFRLAVRLAIRLAADVAARAAIGASQRG